MFKDSISINKINIEKLTRFKKSDLYKIKDESTAKSSYWRYHADQIDTEIDEKKMNIKVTGESGYYIPTSTSFMKNLKRRIKIGFKSPKLICKFISNILDRRFGKIRLMSYHDAFNATMSHDRISDPELSPWRINHITLSKKKGVFKTAESIQVHYKSWSSYNATPNIINHYYYLSILNGYIDNGEVNTLLEIGAGNGNFSSIIYHDWAPVRIIIIDLPETITLAYPFLVNLFPDATILLPDEIGKSLPENFDFVFLTVDQLSLIENNSIDLSINCHSFQEMQNKQIGIYFSLIQRVTKKNGYFFTANRIEKIPSGEHAYVREHIDPPNRFHKYPWNEKNIILVDEVSRFTRLVQLDNIGIRLEKIIKT